MISPPTIRASRALLFPGDQPPLSHFGATLLRHAITTGLRYTAHQLGQPMFSSAPVTIVQLRVYLDRAKLFDTLTGDAGSRIARALVEPGGEETRRVPPALRGSIAFHRARLKIARAPAASRAGDSAAAPRDRPATELWDDFTKRLTDLLPKLNDALLTETIAALDRRRARAEGRTVEPCQSRFAAEYAAGRTTRLDALGAPDLRAPSWAEAVPELTTEPRGSTPPPAPVSPGVASPAVASAAAAPRCRGRGRFREGYRIAVGHLQPHYRALAESAAARGLLIDPDDAYFLPFELGHSLAGEAAPEWLAGAVASNRAEFETAWASPDLPPEQLHTGTHPLIHLGARPDWSWAPLGLLP